MFYKSFVLSKFNFYYKNFYFLSTIIKIWFILKNTEYILVDSKASNTTLNKHHKPLIKGYEKFG